MMNRGTKLGVEGTVDGDTYDIPKGAGYGITTQVTIEGTPGEKATMDGVWDSIEEAGDLPVYVRATLTRVGREWPWTKVVSKYDIEYQAVHMAEGSILAGLGALIITLLPLVLEFIYIILVSVAITYVILNVKAVAQWLASLDPRVVAAGVGVGVVLLVALMLMGDEK